MNRTSKKIETRILYAITFLLCIGTFQSVFSQGRELKHILLLSSYYPDKEETKVIISHLSQKLNSETNCRVTVEYMDSESTTNIEDWKNWMVDLFDAYKTPPDVIVCIGGEAWMTYTVSCPQAWAKIPVVLGCVKSGYINYVHISPPDIKGIEEICPTQESFGDFRVTGYYINDYFKENMELIRHLQPQKRRIAYIYDNRYGFRFLTEYLRKIAREVGFEDLRSYYGNELTTMQLVDSLMTKDSTYAILSSGWYTDTQRYPHAYSMLHNELSLTQSKYFYLIMDQGKLNPNYLGGYFVSAEDIGRDLANLIYEVLTKGLEHSPKFQMTPSAPKYHLNYKTLQSSGISCESLPPKTVLYNKEESFFKLYFWQILAITLAVGVIIIVLVLRIHSYKQVTAVKIRMMEEQKRLREQADESNRLKSAYLANMSHEIRTPLNAIVGFSTQLSEAENKEEAKMYLEIIETNNDLLLQLINDILDLSKIESGTLDFVYTETDVVEVCRSLEKIYLPRIKEGVLLRCELPDTECIIHTERNRVTQVISNFLSNAVKFTEKGYIRFGYKHVENGLYFYVEDTGKGIATENLSKVFIRFEKFDKFVSGSGLGMSICKTIVEKMDGKIGVDSQLGIGSMFWFTLPCKVVHDVNHETVEKNNHTVPNIQTTGTQKTILISEDTESNFILLDCILRKDYHLIWAKNGKEAIEEYHRNHPDLILMDLKMPVIDGWEAISTIRKEDRQVPIVALTAFAYANDRKRAMDEGCNAFLTKPIKQDQLWETLRQLGI